MTTALVRDYMSTPVYTVQQDVALAEVDLMLERYDVSALGVENAEGKPVGVISRSDLFRIGQVRAGGSNRTTLIVPDGTVADAMHTDVVSVAPGESLVDVAKLMGDKHIHRIFVVEGDELRGVVSTHDMMRALVDARVATPIGELMSSKILSIAADESLSLAAERIAETDKHGLVVLDGEWPVGIITKESLLVARDWPAHTPVEEWMSLRILCLPVGMPAYRAAAHALAMSVRYVLAMNDDGLTGVLTGIDFARAVVYRNPVE
jgi:CBS domain-containing protein